jgi:hypothetical protein
MQQGRINWKFLGVNTLAAILLILGARQIFILLYGSRFLEGMYLYGSDLEKVNSFVFQGADGSLFDLVTNYNIGRAISGLLGCIISIVITYIVARRQNTSKINILFVFAIGVGIAILVSRNNFDFHHIIPSLRSVIGWIGIRTVFTINIILLVTTALLLHLDKNLKKHFYQQGA